MSDQIRYENHNNSFKKIYRIVFISFFINFLIILPLSYIGYLATYFFLQLNMLVAVCLALGSICIASCLTFFIYCQFYNNKKSYALSFWDHINKAVLIADAKGQTLYANKFYWSIIDHKKDASIFDIFGRDRLFSEGLYRLKLAAMAGKSAKEKFYISMQSSLLSKLAEQMHSTPQWVEMSVQPAGQLKETLWVIEPLAAINEMEQASCQKMQDNITHLDQSPGGFFSINKSREIIFLNASFASFIGVNLDNFVPGSVKLDTIIYPDDLAIIINGLDDNEAKGIQHCQLRLQTENHEKKCMDLFYYRQNINGPEDGIARFVAVPVFVEKPSTVPLAKNQDEQTDRYLTACPVAMATLGLDGMVKRWNKQFTQVLAFDHSSDQDKNTLAALINAHDHASLEKVFSHLRNKNSEIESLDTTLSTQTNKHIKLYIGAAKDKLRHYNEEAFIVVVIETTEHKTLEEKMAQSQKMQAVGQLAGGIAHDFNNVLTAIIMSCDLLLSSHRSSDPSHPDLLNIKNNANRAASLVQQLLAFSRRQTLRPEVLDVTDFLSDIRMLLLRLLGTTVELKILHGRDLWPIEVDQASLERVVMNLAINAHDAMPSGGSITISTSNLSKADAKLLNYRAFAANDYVEIQVADTGTGIPLDVKEKIFEPFFTTKKVGKGTGLGLSMVYGIIKQTGGYVYCDSQIGKGTTFRIFLPRYVEAKKNNSVEQKMEGQRADNKRAEKYVDLSGTATVLLVEDEDAVRIGGVRALQTRGYTVLEASTGVEALEILQQHDGAVDIVVSDVVMPEMDGPTLLCELRKNYPEIKFIFVSGYAKDAFSKNLPENAEFGFLAKPFSLKALASHVKDMLAQ